MIDWFTKSNAVLQEVLTHRPDYPCTGCSRGQKVLHLEASMHADQIMIPQVIGVDADACVAIGSPDDERYGPSPRASANAALTVLSLHLRDFLMAAEYLALGAVAELSQRRLFRSVGT